VNLKFIRNTSVGAAQPKGGKKTCSKKPSAAARPKVIEIPSNHHDGPRKGGKKMFLVFTRGATILDKKRCDSGGTCGLAPGFVVDRTNTGGAKKKRSLTPGQLISKGQECLGHEKKKRGRGQAALKRPAPPTTMNTCDHRHLPRCHADERIKKVRTKRRKKKVAPHRGSSNQHRSVGVGRRKDEKTQGP